MKCENVSKKTRFKGEFVPCTIEFSGSFSPVRAAPNRWASWISRKVLIYLPVFEIKKTKCSSKRSLFSFFVPKAITF